ncbi:hypothetical protein B0T25DRAFT_618350 [Lasiosphaeria hispida]|uniref:Uncharacterized protein n=1 Tax=Lasiosphaeria hispida TaxID=260671 RepID=A0AAJ0M7K4_9PEZI|nr:hypothetical protein B0T25DRAFT_618350 [Lasiosphaeria hispida]
MSAQIVSKNGTWTARVDEAFSLDFSNDEGSLHLSRDKDGAPIDGSVSLNGIKVSSGDNNITIGGGTQEGKWNGSLSYGKTTVNLLGGHFDLGDGRTDDFQFSFTASPTLLGPQWTGVATNTYTETHNVDISVPHVQENRSKEVAKMERTHPLFDIAGVVIPRSTFLEWATSLHFTMDVDVALNGDKPATVKVTRALKLEVRPIFMPFLDLTWPKLPALPGWFDKMKQRVEGELMQLGAELRAVLQFLEHALQEVLTWQNIERFILMASIAVTAVATATALASAAAAAAAICLGANPLADAAAIEAGVALVAATGDLAAAKLAVQTAKAGLVWGAEKATSKVITTQMAAGIAAIAATIVAGTVLSEAAVAPGAQAYFDKLADKHGLNTADGDLDALGRSLESMRSAVANEVGQLSWDLQQATEDLREAAGLATKLLEYQVMLESWMATDHTHAPFLTWPDTNLRVSDSSEDAEVVDVGDISKPKLFAAAAARMEAYATQKGYNGFVMIEFQRKAYFRRGDVAGLLATLDSGEYAKGMVSYVKAERLPMNVVIDRWAAIHAANGA